MGSGTRRDAVEIAHQLFREWRDDRVSGLAAEIAFFGVLGLFPGLLVTRQLFLERHVGLLSVGAVAAAWTMARGFAAVVRALNVAYDIEEERGWVRRQLLGLALALGTVVVGAVCC